MATTTTTIRPSAKVSDSGFTGTTASTGATSAVLAAISDASDNTYARKPASGSSYSATYALADPSPARPSSSEMVWYVTQNVRLVQGANGYLYVGGVNTSGAGLISRTISGAQGSILSTSTYSRSAGSSTMTVTTTAAHGLTTGDSVVVEGLTGTSVNGVYTVTVTSTTQFTYTSGATTAASGTTGGTISKPTTVSTSQYFDPTASTTAYAWSQTALQNLRANFIDSGTSAARARIFDVWYDVVTVPLPTVSISDIDGDSSAPYSVTTTTRPVLNFTYSQGDGVAQNGAQVRVFTSSKTDPTSDTGLVWDSGVLGNVSSVTIGDPNSTYPAGVDLANGTTYYVYVRVGSTPSGLAQNRIWSAWGSGTASSTITFSVSLTAPTTPTLTASWDAPTAKATLTVTGSSFATGSQVWSVQRSADGGTTWYAVRGATDGNSTAAGVAPSTWTVYDYEAERGTTTAGKTIRYRVKATGTLTAGGATVASPWSSSVTLSTTNSGTWVLRSFTTTTATAPAYDLVGARVLADVTVTREESVGVFRPLGRTTAVVVHGDLTGRDGEWEIIADATEWATLEQIVNGQRLVLVCDPFGGHRYVRIISREYDVLGAAAVPRYQVRVGYVEVGSDIAAGS